MIYHVQKGDTLYSIAKEQGLDANRIAMDNELRHPDRLIPGEELLLIKPTRTYTVKRGDTLESIAERFGVSVHTLCRNNPHLSERHRCIPGEVLILSYATGTHGALCVNGYVYPGCDAERFRAALPRVQYMTFSGAQTDGKTLIFVDRFDEYRKEAKEKNVLCLCRITFAPESDISAFFDKIKANFLAETIAESAYQAGFDGVLTAFYAPFESDAASVFGETLAERLKARKLLFFNETDGNKKAPVLPFADATVLTYEKANEREPASFEAGEKALLQYYEKAGKASKIMLALSPFAYLDGVPVTRDQARQTAVSEGGEIRYDEKTMLSSFRTPSHFVVFESLENIKAKFALLDELGYMGVALDVSRTETPILLLAATEFAPVDYVFYSVKET